MNTIVTYAHVTDPDGTRFRQYKKDPLPKWAVNVRNESGTKEPRQAACRRAKLYSMSDEIAVAVSEILTKWRPHFKRRRYSPRLIAYYVSFGAMQAADTLYRKSKKAVEL